MNILVLDDRAVFAEALAALICKQLPEACVNTGKISAVKCPEGFDLVILSINTDCCDVSTVITQKTPHSSTLALVQNDDLEAARILLENGIKGVMLSNHSVPEMLSAMKQCQKNFSYVPHIVKEYISLHKLQLAELDRQRQIIGLTGRQLEVLRLMEQRLSNNEMADSLHVSLATIKTHVNNLYCALGVNNRRACVQRAHAVGLLYASDNTRIAV